jgi:hypothetical protein
MRLVELVGIYDDAILICKRARRADLQADYEARRAAYESLRAKLGRVVGRRLGVLRTPNPRSHAIGTVCMTTTTETSQCT